MSTLEAFGFQRRKQQQPATVEKKTTCVESIEPALHAAHPWLCASPDTKPITIESSRSKEKRVVTTKPKKAKSKTKKQNGDITRYLSAQPDDEQDQVVCVIRKQVPFQEVWQMLLEDYTTKRRRKTEEEERPTKKIQVDHEFLLQFEQLLCGSPMEVCEEDRRVTLRQQMSVAESMAYIHTIMQEFSI